MIFNEETPFDIAATIKTESATRAIFDFYHIMANYGQLFTNTDMLQTLVKMSPKWYQTKLHYAEGDHCKALKQMGNEVSRTLSPSTKTKLPFEAFDITGIGKGTKRYLVKIKKGFDLSMV